MTIFAAAQRGDEIKNVLSSRRTPHKPHTHTQPHRRGTNIFDIGSLINSEHVRYVRCARRVLHPRRDPKRTRSPRAHMEQAE